VFVSGCTTGGYTYGKIDTKELIPENASVGIIYSPNNSQNTIAYALLKGLSTLHTKGKLGLVTWEDTKDVDYILLANGDTTCPAPSEAAVKGAVGVLITGLSFAFAPLGVSATPMSHVNAHIGVYKKDRTMMIGSGLLVSSGSSVIVNCDKMMYKVASRLYDQQFSKPVVAEK